MYSGYNTLSLQTLLVYFLALYLLHIKSLPVSHVFGASPELCCVSIRFGVAVTRIRDAFPW